MRSIDIHAHLTPQWPVAWILGMKSLPQDEKDAILSKNLERLLGI